MEGIGLVTPTQGPTGIQVTKIRICLLLIYETPVYQQLYQRKYSLRYSLLHPNEMSPLWWYFRDWQQRMFSKWQHLKVILITMTKCYTGACLLVAKTAV